MRPRDHYWPPAHPLFHFSFLPVSSPPFLCDTLGLNRSLELCCVGVVRSVSHTHTFRGNRPHAVSLKTLTVCAVNQTLLCPYAERKVWHHLTAQTHANIPYCALSGPARTLVYIEHFITSIAINTRHRPPSLSPERFVNLILFTRRTVKSFRKNKEEIFKQAALNEPRFSVLLPASAFS